MARRPRNFRERDDPVARLHEDELLERYRFNRRGIDHLVGLLEADLTHPTNRNHALSAELQILIALRYYATGSMQKVLADTVFVSQPTVSRVVDRVTDALCRQSDQYIRPCTQEEEVEVKRDFFNIAGFPAVIGLVDGTHIRIVSPFVHEEEYVNRKQFHSINVQILVDSKSIIRNIVARWPGSTHDARIMRESALYRQYEAEGPHGYILGDSGYMIKPWLMTPYGAAQGLHQENYNRAHKQTRALVERAIGQIKRRFHVLHGEIRLSPQKACRITTACAVLHNLAKLLQLPPIGDEEDDNNDNDNNNVNNGAVDNPDGVAVRNYIANNYF